MSFFSGIGKMVLPCEDTIRNELQKINKGELITLPKLRENITLQFGVTTSCPKSTLKTIRFMMEDQNSGAYRVINGKGELVAKDTEFQSALLKEDGLKIDSSKTKLKVVDFKNHLISGKNE